MSDCRVVPVVILGLGGVGRALVRMVLHGSRDAVQRRACVRFAFIALADSSRCWWPQFDDTDSVDAVLEEKEKRERGKSGGKTNATEIVRKALEMTTEKKLIVIDATASDETEPALALAVKSGRACVVLANKRPLAASWGVSSKYFGTSIVRHESTVGGGDPVIAGLRYVLDVGDSPVRIRGQLSGSLAFVLETVDRGNGAVSFSQAVSQAQKLGYTEPDPRDDLCGADVVRKLVILARASGVDGFEASDVSVRALVNEAVMSAPCEGLIAEIARTMDSEMERRRIEASKKGCVLRFIGELSICSGKATASAQIQEVPQTSPEVVMPPHVSIWTKNVWNSRPLIVAGAVAGNEMTAAGVLGDMVALCREKLV